MVSALVSGHVGDTDAMRYRRGAWSTAGAGPAAARRRHRLLAYLFLSTHRRRYYHVIPVGAHCSWSFVHQQSVFLSVNSRRQGAAQRFDTGPRNTGVKTGFVYKIKTPGLKQF